MRSVPMLRAAAVAAILAVRCHPALCAVYYVSPSGSDAADGLSWASAKRSIAAAAAAAQYRDQVWVAAGAYTGPVMLKSGVAIYGGFAGHETSRDERDISANPVILTVPGPAPAVYIYAGASVFTRLDGVRISGCGGEGIRTGDGSASIRDCEITGNAGAGIVFTGGAHLVSGCRITGNGGPGLDCAYGAGPYVTECTVSGNAGGGVVCSGGSMPFLDRCYLRDNTGGGILCSEWSSATVRCCVITGSNGPGVSCEDGPGLSLVNNTVAGNQGAGLLLGSGTTAINNIVAFNGSGISVAAGGEPPVLLHNCVYGNAAGDYIGTGPAPGDVRADPRFADRSSWDVRILPSSPCRDAGYDPAASEIMADIDGGPRRKGSAVDIGAYEVDGAIPAVSSIPELRAAPPGTPAEGVRGIVSAAWPRVFYLQKEDRACGIRVELAGHALQAGDRAAVSGTSGLTAAGEPCLFAASAVREGASSVSALAAAGRDLLPGRALSPAGLLVRVAGRVTRSVPAQGAFTVDDGSGLRDAQGYPGVRVHCGALTPPPAGSFVLVTGACSCEQAAGGLVPLLLPRTAQDIVPVSP